ncbi:acyltransferase family protein [Desulfoluna butyratoxydans]|uniref:Acyltransferase 3 n=1 Tax=Desulfoluna butyratoxydans TaxID=231438 RepID=A0A4U8YSG4_9BACT|nr:acyltransferase family protein [Desulfoluna butyratoxydans]VFQ46880.1 acyltransferase 3 [Desulfoluna butyratoxydans]
MDKYRLDIDGLRALAVISVLFFHVDFENFRGGFLGVDVFFVISGFLITRLIIDEVAETKTFSFSNFYLRRARRLLPALFCTLGVSLIFAFLLFSINDFKQFSGSLGSAVIATSNIFFWNESGYFDSSAAVKPLLHTWSLSVEEQFYLIWPLALATYIKKRNLNTLHYFLITIGLVSLFLNVIFEASIASKITQLFPLLSGVFKESSSSIFFLTPFRVLEFIFGAILVWAINYRPNNEVFLEPLFILGMGLICYSVVNFSEDTLYPSINKLIPCIGAVLVIYGGATSFCGRILRNTIAVTIGKISYSLYLVHWPIVVFYKYYSQAPLTQKEQISIIIASFLFGFLMYKFVEVPFRRGSFLFNFMTPRKFVGSCASIAGTILIISVHIWFNGGWSWRISNIPDAIAKSIEKGSTQFHKDLYGGVGFPSTGFLGEKNSPPDIVLIGDSHARHYTNGLYEEIGLPFKKKIYISSTSCLILPNLTRMTPGRDWDNLCPNALERALKQAEANPDSTFIISEFWSYQLERAGTLNPKKKINLGSSPEAYRVVIDQLNQLKKIIGDRKLIIIGSVPGTNRQLMIDCFTRPEYIKPIKKDFEFPKEIGFGYKGNQMLSEYASNTKDIYFLNPYDAFCPDGTCHPVVGNDIYFTDESHLSKEGSIKVIRYFRDEILDIINNKV